MVNAMRRLNNLSTYEVKTERGRYAVTLEKLKNTAAGAPRFKAAIITLAVNGEDARDYFHTPCYTFTGRYLSDLDEARNIVNAYEKEIA